MNVRASCNAVCVQNGCIAGCATYLHLDNHFIYLRLQLAQILDEEHAQNHGRGVQLIICTRIAQPTLMLCVHTLRAAMSDH